MNQEKNKELIVKRKGPFVPENRSFLRKKKRYSCQIIGSLKSYRVNCCATWARDALVQRTALKSAQRRIHQIAQLGPPCETKKYQQLAYEPGALLGAFLGTVYARLSKMCI